jgi:signal transduction histidine kinase
MNACSLILGDPERLKAVADSGLLDSTVDEAFQQLNRLATIILKAPISIFSVFGKENQFFRSMVGMSPEIQPGLEFPVDLSVCKYALEGKPIQFFDTKNDLLFKDNQAVQQMNIAGYLGIPVITKEGHALGTVCVFDHVSREWTPEEMDCLQIITNSFLTEIELRIALRKSAGEVSKREEFMAIAAHEMRSPLSSMKLHADLCTLKLKRGLLDADEFGDYLQTFRRQFQRVSLLIDDMFDVSRIQSGQFTIRPAPCNLNELIDIIVANFNQKFIESGASFSSNCDANLEGSWDAYRIEQVISNLLSNALKYAPGAKTVISALRSHPSVVISIQDDGPGIDDEAQKKIFLPFERDNIDKSVSGLGLGLYISRRIIEAHQGSLTIHSTPGTGSTFRITLPA